MLIWLPVSTEPAFQQSVAAAMGIGESNEIARLKESCGVINCTVGYMLKLCPQLIK